MTVDAADAARWLRDGEEIALLDTREAVAHGFGHPLAATNAPLSRLELIARALVPRLDTRVLVFDEDARARLAAERLASMGYTQLHVIEGGRDGWIGAGETLFPEQQAFSKGFGAFVNRWASPESISPHELDAALSSETPPVVLDARPPAEFQRGNIPGSVDAPGPDMLWSFDDLVPDADTEIVVNCMSRTRGTLGALTLRAAGVPNRVRILHDGTRNWLLNGLSLEQGASRFATAPARETRARAVRRARALATRLRLPTIDAATLDRWRDDATRTTYVIDVRSPDEYASGHLRDARNVPHGSLYMHPDHDLATLNARVVLVDDDGVRATVNAMWLTHMGWECACLCIDPAGGDLVTAPWSAPSPDLPEVAEITPSELLSASSTSRAPVIDVDTSVEFEAAHIEGATWCDRPRLGEYLGAHFGDVERIVVTCRDGRLARFAAADHAACASSRVIALQGGTHAWRAAGGTIAHGTQGITLSRDDRWLLSSERPGDQRENVMAYLEWEDRLDRDIERAGWVPYRNLLFSGG